MTEAEIAAQAEAAKAAEAEAAQAAEAKAAEEAAKAAEAEAAKNGAEAEAEDSAETTEDAAENSEDKGEGNEDATELDVSVWGDGGDDVANSVLLTLQNANVSPEDAKALLWDAVQAGKPEDIDRDALVEKVGKATANLIMAGVENVVGKRKTIQAEVRKTVNEAAGGADAWDKVAEWANKNMSTEDLDGYRDMIDGNNPKARAFAAAEIVKAYNAAPANTALNVNQTVEGDGGVAGDSVEPLTAVQWIEAKENAIRKKRPQSEIAKIDAGRAAGKKLGI